MGERCLSDVHAGSRASRREIPASDGKVETAEADRVLLDAVNLWLLDSNSGFVCRLLPHAAAFSGRSRQLLDALGPLLQENPNLDIATAVSALERCEGDLAAYLTELFEAIPEGEMGHEPPLLLHQSPPVEVLPKSLRDMIECGAACIRCDPAYLLAGVLTAAAAAIGLSRRAKLSSSWEEPPILWIAVVAPTGSKKSPPLDFSIAPLRALEDEIHVSFRAKLDTYVQEHREYEAHYCQWKRKSAQTPQPVEPQRPPEPRIVVSNTTIEALGPILEANPRGLLLVRDELSGWLGSFDAYRGGKGGDAAAWEELYHGRRLTIDRKTSERGSIRIPMAGVSVVGTIQPETLRRLLTPELREGGLAARIVLLSPPPAFGGRPLAEVPESVIRTYREVLARLRGLKLGADENGTPRSISLPLSRIAEARWWEWNERWNESRKDLEGDLAAFSSKLEAMVPRLALIFTLVEWAEKGGPEPLEVLLDALEAAIRMTEYFWREGQRAYGFLMASTTGPVAARASLVQWIERHGGTTTVRTLSTSGPRKKYRGNAQVAETDLQQLVALGYGRWVDIPAPQGPGRPPGRQFWLISRARGSEIREFLRKRGILIPLPPRSTPGAQGTGRVQRADLQAPVAPEGELTTCAIPPIPQSDEDDPQEDLPPESCGGPWQPEEEELC